MNKELRVIILAAGKGTRMNSDLPKVLHKLHGKALIDYVIDESELLDPKEIILVVGFKKERVIKHTESRINLKYATQVKQLGTGHAVLQTKELLKNKKGHILILYGDVPNIKASTLLPIVDNHIINNRDLTLITGQKPVVTKAKLSIANFNLREGMRVGIKVTLRSKKMWDFWDRLVNLSLPRIRDFRGISPNSFDGNGNYNLGIKEHIIFPEINFDKVDKVRGMDITIKIGRAHV